MLTGNFFKVKLPDVELLRALQVSPDKLKPGQVYAVRDPERPATVYSGDITNTEMFTDWVQQNAYPIVQELSSTTQGTIFSTPGLVAILAVDGLVSQVQMTSMQGYSALISAARHWNDGRERSGKVVVNPKNDVQFVWVNGVEHAVYLSHVFSIGEGQLPKLIVARPSKEEYCDTNANGAPIGLTEQEIVAAVQAMIEGTANVKYSGGQVSRIIRGFQGLLASAFYYFADRPLLVIISFVALFVLVMWLNSKKEKYARIPRKAD